MIYKFLIDCITPECNDLDTIKAGEFFEVTEYSEPLGFVRGNVIGRTKGNPVEISIQALEFCAIRMKKVEGIDDGGNKE